MKNADWIVVKASLEKRRHLPKRNEAKRMESEKKKQFSLSLAIRIFLVILVVLSVGVFATSIMKYNQLQNEKRELEKKLSQYEALMEELSRQSGSAEKLGQVLAEYKTYRSLREDMFTDSSVRAQCEEILMRIDELLEDPETKAYLIKLAKENGLAFPDETIYYIDPGR